MPEVNQSLCLVDGTYELFRAFYGAPSRLSKDQVEIGATLSLARSLRALVRSGEFTHFAVAFDTVIESFRNQLFDGYKTGEGIDPTLHAQFPFAEQVTDALGFVVLGMIEVEADDALASAAAQFYDPTTLAEIVIASPDKDLRQCVRPGVCTWDRMRDVRYDEAGVVKKMGVEPQLVPDYLALVGDAADGIPGVPRFGARSTSTVLSHFGQLEKIPRDSSQWDIKVRGAASLVQNLKDHEEEVVLYRTLATLKTDVELGVSLEDMRYKGPTEAKVTALEDQWGAKI